ncbi:MAG: hypothetical protein AAF217_10950 [Pseudomonadota bacterium]
MFRLIRIMTALMICAVILLGVVTGGVYLLLQGKAGKGSAVNGQIETIAEQVLGPNYELELQNTEIDFSQIGFVMLKTENARVLRKSDDTEITSIGKLEVRTNLVDTLLGKYGFDFARISEIIVDSNIIRGEYPPIPKFLNQPFDILGVGLSKIKNTIEDTKFKSLEVRDLTIKGPAFGRRSTSPLVLATLRIAPSKSDGDIAMDGTFNTEFTRGFLSANYSSVGSEGRSVFTVETSQIDAREWLREPESKTGFLASDVKFNIKANVEFNSENQAQTPSVLVNVGSGTLRIGRRAYADVKEAELNLRFFLNKNQIEIDPSVLQVGNMQAKLGGGIRPANLAEGYHGNLQYDLILQQQNNSAEPSEEFVASALKLSGILKPETNQIDLKTMLLKTHKGQVNGQGTITLSNDGPAISATAETNGISVQALQQYWPFFIAGGARKWVNDHVKEGWIYSGSARADIPKDVLFKLREGAILTPEQYNVTIDVDEFRFRPFGELPDIENASGRIELDGMAVSAELDYGQASITEQGKVDIQSAKFFMENFAAPDKTGETTLSLAGDIKTIATIADRKPLRVMERMKVSANQFSGKGHADIAARFPVGRKSKYEEVQWNVLLDLQNGASSKKLANRAISKANLLVDANPEGANVTGTMSVDGLKSRVWITEPIGQSGTVKRKRVLKASVDEKARAKLGINLDPVIVGPLQVEVLETKGRQFYQIDFKDTKLVLPWIGWSKGKGIPATASFNLTQKGKNVHLSDFNLKGPSFGASGTLTMNKRGLLKGILANVKLNDGDNFQLDIERINENYKVNAIGASYDTRGVMNALFHEGGFSEAQGERTVEVLAQFENIKGFQNRQMRDVNLSYASRGGALQSLSIIAQDNDGGNYSVKADSKGQNTDFDIVTNDAGNALAFTNIYTKMRSGNLSAKLRKQEGVPYRGPVRVKDFFVSDEPRLKRIASNVKRQIREEGARPEVILPEDGNSVRFLLAEAGIERGRGFFNVSNAIVRSPGFGISMNGKVYDANDNMNVTGVFMPANGLNLAVSAIPLLGQLFSNARSNALIGVTYKLEGPRVSPTLTINPLSVMAPGVFKQMFDFKK